MRDQAAQNSSYAEAYFRQGRYDLALQFFTQSLNQNTSIDNAEGITQSYVAIGKTYMAMGSLDMAEDILLKAGSGPGRPAPPFFSWRPTVWASCTLPREIRKRGSLFSMRRSAMPASSRTPAQTAQLYHNLGTAQKALRNYPMALEYFNTSLANQHGQQAHRIGRGGPLHDRLRVFPAGAL